MLALIQKEKDALLSKHVSKKRNFAPRPSAKGGQKQKQSPAKAGPASMNLLTKFFKPSNNN